MKVDGKPYRSLWADPPARRVHLMDGKVVDLHLVDSMPERDVPSLAAVLS